jgi:putative copper export protein
MENEPLLSWQEMLTQLVGFVALFLAVGAIGFRLVVRRAGRGQGNDLERAALREASDRASSTAASLGIGGALVSLLLMLTRLPALAARRHLEVGQLVTQDRMTQAQIVLAIVAILGFALAITRKPAGFPLAAVGVFAGTLRAAFFGQWARLVNPAHMLAGGLWIGTLFVLVVAGFPAILGARALGERRGPAIAALVNAFSPLALGSAATLALFGVITAFRHLTPFAALWTTPYGYALIAKLSVVAGVLALGAWNWRRQRPRLGGEAGALAIRRSAATELAVAGVVLVLTAILVSLPAPKRPQSPAASNATGAPPR